MKEIKEIKYTGPEIPKRKSNKIVLEAVNYAKSVLANNGFYEAAAHIRELERDLNDKFQLKIIK